MNIIVTLLVAFPLGFFIATRIAAYLAFVTVYFLGFVSASVLLIVEWAGGSTQAFGSFPDADSGQVSSYIVVNMAVFVTGALLVLWGGAVRRKRRSGGTSTATAG